MAQRKTPGTSKITRDTTAPKRAQRTSDATVQSIAAEDIARRAYERFVMRGYQHGDDVADWLAAEAELRASH
jgi:hypothetical protein